MRVLRVYESGTGDVWNLSVAETPEYFANGILVHNCIMAMWASAGSWADAYGTTAMCGECERSFRPDLPDGKMRTRCPFCRAPLDEPEGEAA